MKYLKGYKLFESSEDINLLEVEEAFYNISDNFDVKVLSGGIEIFTTATEYNYITTNYSDLIDIIKVSIQSEKVPSMLEYDDIKDDLKFAVDYITNELDLSLLGLFIFNEYNRIHYKKNLKNIEVGYFRLINLYFKKDTKKRAEISI